MNDFDYENMQKKITARGARHKRNGSKSKKCTMPSDFMTKAQLQALNGPVTTILLNQPMDWETFKGLSDTLQKTYLTNLKSTYNPNTAMLARMFGVTPNPVTAQLRKYGLPIGPRGAKPDKQRQAMWEAFCNGVVGGGDNKPVEEPKKDEPQFTCYDIEAEELERAKAAVDAMCHSEEQNEDPVPEPEETPDNYDWRDDWSCNTAYPDPVEPDPDEELADAMVDALNKAFTPLPCSMSKLATTMTGSPEGVVDNIRDLLSLFSGKVSVKLSIEVTE